MMTKRNVYRIMLALIIAMLISMAFVCGVDPREACRAECRSHLEYTQEDLYRCYAECERAYKEGQQKEIELYVISD